MEINNEILERNHKELSSLLPSNLMSLLEQNDGASIFLRELPQTFSPESVVSINSQPKNQRAWELVGIHYMNYGHIYESLALFKELYEHMFKGQQKLGHRVHKGMPLVFISDCYKRIGYQVLAKRYLMLTLCEDAISANGVVSPEKSGTYFRLVWLSGMSHVEFENYSKKIYGIFRANPKLSEYPEWILQQLDQEWMTEIPTPDESMIYLVNKEYVEFLISNLNEPTGKNLETLSSYVLSCIPGCKSVLRERTHSTDYDIVCYLEGIKADFREEIDRYFICECKDWNRPADFTTFAKFCRVLDSIKSKFGIIFSYHGISGAGTTSNAEREQLKVFQDRGMVIIVIP